MITEIRADVVSSIVQPGRFIEIEDGLTVHIRDRTADGTLTGLLLDDRRSADHRHHLLAETGRVVETDGNTLLVMTNGSVQRMERPDDELTVVAFDAYGFDLYDADLRSGVDHLPPVRAHPDRAAGAHRSERHLPGRTRGPVHHRAARPPVAAAGAVRLRAGGVPLRGRSANAPPEPDGRDHRRGHRRRGGAGRRLRHAAGGRASARRSPTCRYVLLVAVGGGALALIVTDRRITVHERCGACVATYAERLVRPREEPRHDRPRHRSGALGLHRR